MEAAENTGRMLRSRHRKMCFVVVLVLLSMAWSTIAVNTEGKMLNIFKLSLNDSKNLLGDWSTDLFSPCGIWSYIRCDNVNEHVVSITLANMGFSGTISPSIGNLKFLTYLTLEGNNLTGGIPPELGNMSSLQNLNLANNNLTRDIPSSLGKLSKLKYLTLRNNNLSGGIPHSLSALQNLIELDLSNNNLKGEIPESLFEVHKYDFTGNLFNCSNFPHKHTCASVSSSKSGSSKTLKIGILAGSIGGIVIILAAVLVFLLFWGQHREVFVDVSGEDDRKIGFGQLKRFSWRELQLATDNFSEKSMLGQGGFGKVYKGVLGDNTRVAVKRMTDYHSPGGEAAFLREVEMISVAVHRNLLRLIGFCVAPSERLLVYPYMENLSVAHRLRELKPGEFFLDWHTRKRIALGAACGLEYLHEHCNPKIIHRDVKAANVLLDENFEAVVGDFGLAKLVDTRKTHVSTQVRGTIGHIAPEYLSTGRSSERTDVFGYGITLLELVTGQRAIDFSRQREDDVLLLDHVKKLEREKCLDAIVDENLKQNYDARELEVIVQVALLCTQISPEGRPTMSEVVRLLEGDGLKERWKEWQQAEAIHHQEIEMMPRRFEWAENSISSQSAVELSGGR